MNRRIGFPLIVGLTVAQDASLSAGLLTAIRDVFKKLRERSHFGALIIHSASAESAEQIAEAAKEAGVNYRATEGVSGAQTVVSAKGGLTRADMELAETADVLILISSATAHHDNGKNDDLLTYAHGIGRPTICIDGKTGRIDGELPEQIEVDQGWLPELFEIAGLSPDADLETIKSKMSAVANKSAPLTRSKWNWIVFLQGLAVCIPLGWLLGFPVRIVGLAAFGSTLLLFALHYWLRWRSMQKTWARARLVAEATRSLIATARYPDASPWHALNAVPSLRPLRWATPPATNEHSFDKWIEHYNEKRVSAQQKYFTDKRKDAEGQRKKLTSWTTRLLDAAMVFALVGLVIVFTPSGNEWMVGGTFSSSALGLLSVLILLGLLLVQIVRELHELNRRTARFAQQEAVLSDAIARLNCVQSPELALEIVSDTEGKLLTEVLEWYFHAETAERFVEVRARARRTSPQSFLKDESATRRLAHAIPGKAGTASLFVLGAIVGRLPYIVIPAAAVVVWIFYKLPDQGANVRQLEDVHLLQADDKSPFDPTPEQARRGIVVMVHGLYGLGALTEDAEENERNWMKPCADAMKERLNDKELAICLVDWSKAARPSDFYNRVFGERSFLSDVPAIRAQAYRVGDVVAFKLAGIIMKNKLTHSEPIPFHLIGHSAGGFVVTRVARRLTQLGIVPPDPKSKMLHVTILDTPEPDDQILEQLPKLWPTDFYLSSYNVFQFPFKQVLQLEKNTTGLQVKKLEEKMLEQVMAKECNKKEDKPGFWVRVSRKIPIIRGGEKFWIAHRGACCWFRWTIKNPDAEPRGEGFNDSPLLSQIPAVEH